MDGLGFLEKIKASHADPLTLLITAYGSKDVFLKAESLGVHAFIDKPFTIETIQDSLNRLIEKLEK
jgi:DNA-binding NtrC family response regulator